MEFINVIAVVSVGIMDGMWKWSNFELCGVIVKFIIFRKENRLIIKYLPIYRRKSSYLVSFPENELSSQQSVFISCTIAIREIIKMKTTRRKLLLWIIVNFFLYWKYRGSLLSYTRLLRTLVESYALTLITHG